MSALRKFELICGILTFLLAITVSVALALPRDFSQFWPSLPLYNTPAFLVALGSYFHAVRRKANGFVVVIVASSILTLMMYPVIFGGFYVYGHRGGLLGLAPVMAILTMIISILVERSANKASRAR